MIVGFVGAGSMAGAMARGLQGQVDRMLFSDSGSGRAGELAAELGGEAVGSNVELAERSDLVVLAVKPAKLADVAVELASAKVVISLSGGPRWRRLRPFFPMPRWSG